MSDWLLPPGLLLQMKHGEVFVTDTDTEVIPKLCKFLYSRLTDKPPFPKVGGPWGALSGLKGAV
jgi:glucosamine 6-phosphate synthetase-like amidotransferase/phosphosugar isomerase protein